jgi:hypothetical protein
MSDLQSELRKTVADFVAEISTLATRAAVDALERALGGNGRRIIATKASRTSRGEKRDQKQLNALAESFYDFVSRHPGLRIEQIKTELKTTTKDLALPVRHLIAGGALKTKGQRRATTYFASDRKTSKRD